MYYKEVGMKRSKITVLLVCVLVALSGGFILGVTPAEKDIVYQNIAVLKDQIKKEQSVYNLALQADLSEEKKVQLTAKYTQARQKLFQQIRKQRDTIGGRMSPVQKLLWDAAKIAGTVALISLAAYSFLTAPPGKIEIPIIEIPIVKTGDDQGNLSGSFLSQNSNQSKSIGDSGLLQPEHPRSLTKEEIFKYRVLYNEFGSGAIVSGTMGMVASLVGAWNPFGVAYFVTSMLTGIGSLYYRQKLGPEDLHGRKLTVWDSFLLIRSFFNKPIVLDEIMIIPEKMPY